MKAFHNDPEIKDSYLQRVREHRIADEITKGVYWEHGKGCAVGCTIHGSNHYQYESELGIPVFLAKLEDEIFEGMTNDRAKGWPEQFLNAINVGADLSSVYVKFYIRILGDSEKGVINRTNNENSKKVIQDVINLFNRKIAGYGVSSEEWGLAADAAYTAACISRAAAAAAAGYVAAGLAADAARVACAARAACAAARTSRAGAARDDHYNWMADILIEELKAVK